MREGSKPVGVNHIAVRKLSRSFAPRVTTRAGTRIPKGLLPYLPASNISGSVQSIAVSVFQAHELSRILIGRYEDRKPQVTNRRGCTEAQTQTGDERRGNGCWLCCRDAERIFDKRSLRGEGTKKLLPSAFGCQLAPSALKLAPKQMQESA